MENKPITDEQIEINKQEIISLLKSTRRNGINGLIHYLESSNFFIDPASAYYHEAYKGGLAQHSLRVYKVLVNFYYNGFIPDVDLDEVIIASLIHDICKANTYQIYQKNVKDDNDKWVKVDAYKVEDEFPFGHGEKSVDILRNFISLTDDEKLAIRWHMGAYEGEKVWNQLSKAQEISKLALYLHFADVIATRYFA